MKQLCSFKLFWIVAFIIFSTVTRAEPVKYAPRVALLTSLNTEALVDATKKVPDLQNYLKRYVDNLHSIYLYQLENKSGLFNVEFDIFDRATSYELWYALWSGYYVAVIYVGHGAPDSVKGDGLGSDPLMVDYWNRDVSEAFAMIHPNVRYVSLVGCYSKTLLEGFAKNRGFFPDRVSLRDARALTKKANQPVHYSVDISDAKVDARDGLSASLEHMMPLVRGYKPLDCKTQQHAPKKGLQVFIRRTMPAVLPKGTEAGPVTISVGSQVMVTLPAAKAGEKQEYATWMALDETAMGANLKVLAKSGASPMLTSTAVEFGKIEILPNDTAWPKNARWDVFGQNGKPIGVASNVFRYKGTLPSESHWFNPAPCIELEPIQKTRDPGYY